MENSNLFLTPLDHNVVIIGYSATGKSYFADALMSMYPAYKLYRSDDYMDVGFKESLYKLKNHIMYDRNNLFKAGNLIPQPKIIVEGIQGYRLLRSGLEDGSFFANSIFVLTASKDTRQKRYLMRKDSIQKMRYLDSFDKTLDKIWTDYKVNLKEFKYNQSVPKPRITEINTDRWHP